jgi:hypothetical protein
MAKKEIDPKSFIIKKKRKDSESAETSQSQSSIWDDDEDDHSESSNISEIRFQIAKMSKKHKSNEEVDDYLQRMPLDTLTAHELFATKTVTRKARYVDNTMPIDLTTEVMAFIKTLTGEIHAKTPKVLIDTGCSKSIINKRVVPQDTLKKKQTKETVWNTNGGSFLTNYSVPITFTLPEFASSKSVTWDMFVDEIDDKNRPYDMIIGRDLQKVLKIDILWSEERMDWDGISVPMRSKSQDHLNHAALVENLGQLYEMTNEDGEIVMQIQNRATKILDAKYKKADIHTFVEALTLSTDERKNLKSLLFKYDELFDGTLGTWDTTPVEFELKEGAQPYHARAFPIPQIHEGTIRKEVERLIKIKVLRKSNDSPWGAPTFIIPKKNRTVRFISDFRVLNTKLVRKPFPIPKIQDIMQKLGGFTYATSLDLNMGYYTIRLSPESSRLCTIVLPWGKYEYTRLPMGVAGSPDIFQEKMSKLMGDLEFVRTYLDDLLIISKSSFTDHLKKVETVLQRLAKVGLKVNIEKSTFGTQKLEYLGYWLTPKGIQPLARKIEAILNLKSPTTLRQLRSFLGMVNYYRDMWKRRSHLISPLTELTIKGKKFNWGEPQEKAFKEIKSILAKETMLTFPDFTKTFHVHADSSEYQLGAVISQDTKPIAFYSRKLNKAQKNYTVGEREMLGLIETLREYRNILLGHDIILYTDHQNLVNPTTTHKSPRIQRWRWMIEEYGPQLTFIEGVKNVVADALSRLDADFNNPLDNMDEPHIAEIMANTMDDDLLEDIFPLCAHVIAKEQNKDKNLNQLIKARPQYFTKATHGSEVIKFKDKIFIPESLRSHVTEWYHEMLCHPGTQRTELTIRQHLTWPNLSEDIAKHIKECHQCQMYKNSRKKYGHTVPRSVHDTPWKTVCIDLIGPYTVRTKAGTLTLQAMTMVDPSTGCFEIVEIPDKHASTCAKLFDRVWLCRYPRPVEAIFDNGKEFTGREFIELLTSYDIKPIPTTVMNPQANYVERVHQTLGNMLRTQELEETPFNTTDPWSDILAKCSWALRSTFHTVARATPGQLIFGRDMIFDVAYKANWADLRKRKRNAIANANDRENNRRIKHKYIPGDLVTKDRPPIQPKLHKKRDGPYNVLRQNDNGTLRIQRGATDETVSLRRVHPYNTRNRVEANQDIA